MPQPFNRIRRRARDLISRIRPNVPPIFFDCSEIPQFARRLHIDRPWIAHGRLWATDGRIAV